MPIRLVQLLALALGAPLVLGAAEPVPPLPPEEGERSFFLSCAKLTIEPGPADAAGRSEATYLGFSGGVTMRGRLRFPGLSAGTPEVTLTADTVELDLRAGGTWDPAAIHWPEVPEAERQRLVSDPGQAIAGMRTELQLPAAALSETNMLRFGAAGNVAVRAAGLLLATSALVSTDGGRSWSAEGRSTFSGREPQGGYQFTLAADYMLADTIGDLVLAQGNVEAEVSSASGPPVKLTGGRCELDLSSRRAVRFEAGTPPAGQGGRVRLATKRRASTDPAGAVGHQAALAIEADVIEASLGEQRAFAHGKVRVIAPAEGLLLRATGLTARFDPDRGLQRVVAYAPVLRQGPSSYRGARLRLTFGADSSVLEVFGPQYARLSVPAAVKPASTR